jgi:hypothetical protein
MVARDQLAQVAKALYSLPREFVGQKLRARADSQTVRFYSKNQMVKAHPRVAMGGRSIDSNDYPKEKTPYATRDIRFLQEQAATQGVSIGKFAQELLSGPLPWTKMRRVYALLGLTKRYGSARVEEACARAIASEMYDVHRLERMLKLAVPLPPPVAKDSTTKVIRLARYLRPASHFALPPASRNADNPGEQTHD